MTALKINPDSSMAHLSLGTILENQGKFDDAITHYSDVLRIEPNSEDGQNNLGVALAKHGKIDDAAAHFSTALKINPSFVETHTNWGWCLLCKAEKKNQISISLRQKGSMPNQQVTPMGLPIKVPRDRRVLEAHSSSCCFIISFQLLIFFIQWVMFRAISNPLKQKEFIFS